MINWSLAWPQQKLIISVKQDSLYLHHEYEFHHSPVTHAHESVVYHCIYNRIEDGGGHRCPCMTPRVAVNVSSYYSPALVKIHCPSQEASKRRATLDPTSYPTGTSYTAFVPRRYMPFIVPEKYVTVAPVKARSAADAAWPRFSTFHAPCQIEMCAGSHGR